MRAGLKLSPGCHTVNNRCDISNVHDCCEMGDVSVEYLCKSNHMSKNSCLRIVRLAVHQNLSTDMKLSFVNVKVGANS